MLSKIKVVGVLLVWLGLIMSLPQIGLSQDKKEKKEGEKLFELEEVVVTGTKTEELLIDVPVRTEIITSADIEAKGAVNLYEALKGMPGIRVLNYRQPAEALTVYKEAFSEEDPSPNRVLRSAEGFIMLRMPAEADTLLRRARRLEQNRPSSLSSDHRRKLLRLEAQRAYLDGDREAAVRAYKRLLGENPLDGEALIALGDLYHETDQLEEAIRVYERAARIAGKETQALVREAQVEVERERYARAVELLEAAQAIEAQPNVARYLEQVRQLAR